VQPAQLQRRGAFLSKKGFTKVQEHLPAQDGWMLLDRRLSGDAAAAIADEATVVWAMGKSVGAEVPCVDESGRTFNVRIVATIGNSILQGGLVISEGNFIERFPSAGGCRVFYDRKLTFGVEWAREIEREIRGADAIVVWPAERSVVRLDDDRRDARVAEMPQGDLDPPLGDFKPGPQHVNDRGPAELNPQVHRRDQVHARLARDKPDFFLHVVRIIVRLGEDRQHLAIPGPIGQHGREGVLKESPIPQMWDNNREPAHGIRLMDGLVSACSRPAPRRPG
jgi:hypothetical protein